MTHALFANFSGLGNGIAVAGLFRAIEKADHSWRYVHNACLGLDDDEFVSRLQLSGFDGLYPGQWRRFAPTDWEAILSYTEGFGITHIINLRNEGPKRDTGYAEFKRAFQDRFAFHDVDQGYADGSIGETNLFREHYRLVRQAGCAAAQEPGWLRTLLGEPATGAGPIGLFLSTSCEIKSWPSEQWIECALALADRGEALVLIAGAGEAERAHAHGIFNRLQTARPAARLRLAQRLSIIELAREIGRCRLLISNDTAAVHLGAALETPSVGLYFATCGTIWGGLSERFAPVQSSFGLTCPEHKPGAGNCLRYGAPCPAPCKDEVTVPRVLASVDRLLAESGRQSHAGSCAAA